MKFSQRVGLGVRRVLGVLAVLTVLGAAPQIAGASSGVVQVVLGGVKHVAARGSILRLSVGNSDVAEISPVGSTEILIKGKQIGSTTLMVWSREGNQASYTIQVVPDAEEVSEALKALFPGEPLSAQMAGTTLVVRGQVTGPDVVAAVDSWLASYRGSLGKEGARLTMLNRVELPPRQQVQLEVRFAEVSRTAMRKFGMSLVGQYQGHTGGVFGPQAGFPDYSKLAATHRGLGPLPLPVTLGEIGAPMSESMGVLFMTDPLMELPFHALISVLSSRGMAKTLSEPTLVALSGQKANFLVGGEFPVPIPLGFNQVSIEYKKFGVQLQFEPVVLKDKAIQLKVGTTVSDLDFTRTIQLQSVAVPSLTSRTSETTVRLRAGQSFAIAGLLSDKMRTTVDKVPLLGDIPVLGMLFRSKQYQREETELIVLVTANLVEPQDSRRVPPLPGEDVISDPNDFELFLMGWGEVDRPVRSKRGSRPAGRVGFRK